MIKKEGWMIKKLGDVCTLLTDGNWIESKDQATEGFRLIQTGNIGKGFFEEKELRSKFISEETFENLKCTEIFEGDCLVSRLPDPIGRACLIPSVPYRMITAVDCSIIRFKKEINPKFFIFYSKSLRYLQDIKSEEKGATRKRISRSNLSSIKIPIPPLTIQHQIVSELDTLSEIITKKKQQIADLDKLAQATFYDMFGDPVSNEKRWGVKLLGEISTLKSGQFVKASDIHSQNTNGLYPCFGGNGLRGYTKTFTHNGIFVLIGRQGALCGNVKIATDEFHATEHAVVCTPLVDYETLWFYYLLKTLNLNKYATGAAQPGLAVGKLELIDIPWTPLSIQNRFAIQVTSIETQKELISKSLVDVQQLFDFTMNKYFN